MNKKKIDKQKSIKNNKNINSKEETPILKTPSETKLGKTITWIIVVAMLFSGLVAVILAVVFGILNHGNI